MKHFSTVRALLVWLGLAGLLVGCGAPSVTATPLPTQATVLQTATPTSVISAEATSGAEATAAPSGQVLRLWLPPQFAPTADTTEAKLLHSQITAFEDAHSGWKVDVRIKKLSGQGGLIDMLQTSLKAAPGVAPDVIALDGAMLMAAATLVQPLSAHIGDDELADYYPFALEAARIDDQLLGLPFAADAIGMVYSTIAYPSPPNSWADLRGESGAVWMPLADQSALVTIQQYSAMGGPVVDAAGQPTLDADALARVLAHYQAMDIAGSLPAASAAAADFSETWNAYRDNRAVAAAVTSSVYFANRRRLTNSAFTLIPTRDGIRLTYASQWNFALVTTDSTRQQTAIELMRWLALPENNGAWTAAANVLPARSKSLDYWATTGLSATAADVLAAARPMPRASLLAFIGPPIATAVQSVLAGQASPDSAASIAAAAIAPK